MEDARRYILLMMAIAAAYALYPLLNQHGGHVDVWSTLVHNKPFVVLSIAFLSLALISLVIRSAIALVFVVLGLVVAGYVHSQIEKGIDEQDLAKSAVSCARNLSVKDIQKIADGSYKVNADAMYNGKRASKSYQVKRMPNGAWRIVDQSGKPINFPGC